MATTREITKKCCSIDLIDDGIGGKIGVNRGVVLAPKCPLHLPVFSDHTSNHIRQQAALDRTLETYKIDVCCVS